ncbi:hypothetical protein Ae168Ps1_4438 [Pseudonocardia sp. Ae168_Ps1]|nr:hypothetical protein Ae168Ps1_4438 [Pseudonocardia sp. Ae168_Ps1]
MLEDLQGGPRARHGERGDGPELVAAQRDRPRVVRHGLPPGQGRVPGARSRYRSTTKSANRATTGGAGRSRSQVNPIDRCAVASVSGT